MDTFFEQIVRKKKTVGELAIMVGVALAALVLCVAAFLFLGGLSAILICGILYGAWYLITMQNKEFEYCVTNGDIDVDLIVAKRKRKRIVSVAGRKIERLLPYDSSVSTQGFQRVVTAAPSLQEEGLWYFTYHSKKNGHTLVVFSPNERVLSAFTEGLDRLVRMDTQRAAAARGIQL